MDRTKKAERLLHEIVGPHIAEHVTNDDTWVVNAHDQN